MKKFKGFFTLVSLILILEYPSPHTNGSYISLDSLVSRYKEWQVSCEMLDLTCEIRSGLHRVRLRTDTPFYILDDMQVTKKRHPVYRQNKILIPQGWVEELEKKLSARVLKSRTKFRKFDTTNVKTRLKTKKINLPSDLSFIIIDPGHGGRDPGARGHKNLLEKNITLKFSKKLVKVLKKEFPLTHILMTRKKDHYLSLEKRSHLANRYLRRKGFGIFLSLHFNATFSTRSRGFEIYYLERNSMNNSERINTINDNLHPIKNRNAKRVISHIMDAQIQVESKVLAREIHRSFVTRIKNMVSSRGIRRADFAVIRAVSMPALLIELGYLTNRQEAITIQTKKFHQKAAQAIAKGIKGFLKRRPGI